MPLFNKCFLHAVKMHASRLGGWVAASVTPIVSSRGSCASIRWVAEEPRGHYRTFLLIKVHRAYNCFFKRFSRDLRSHCSMPSYWKIYFHGRIRTGEMAHGQKFVSRSSNLPLKHLVCWLVIWFQNVCSICSEFDRNYVSSFAFIYQFLGLKGTTSVDNSSMFCEGRMVLRVWPSMYFVIYTINVRSTKLFIVTKIVACASCQYSLQIQWHCSSLLVNLLEVCFPAWHTFLANGH